ncbi:MAG: DNA polymerase III subunit alpha [Puniceicoccales bacterium]|nr:DNA polymerase III subunit alpha [Puniceicoccales bacterium]
MDNGNDAETEMLGGLGGGGASAAPRGALESAMDVALDAAERAGGAGADAGAIAGAGGVFRPAFDDVSAEALAKVSPEFVHLHVHSDYSLLDGCARTEKLLERAYSLGQRAIAITDHGALFGLFEFWSNAKMLSKARGGKIKPLLGCEIYLVFDYALTERPDRATEKRYHMGLLAKDFTGYQNLVKIVSDAHLRGSFYGKPRTDMEQLAAHAGGLVGFSGCMSGVIPRALAAGETDRAKRALARFLDIFGKENFVIEIMDHGLPEQVDLNRQLLELAAANGLRVVCTNDVHYVDHGHVAAHDALLCIQTGAKVADAKRMRYPAKQFYLKSGAEMARIFDGAPDALKNTLAIAEMCDVAFDTDTLNYPEYVLEPAQRERVEVIFAGGNGSADTGATAAGATGSAAASAATPLDRILDSYVALKNGLLAQQGKAADFAFSDEQRAKMRVNGAYLLDLCKKGLRARYGVNYDDPAARADDAPRGTGAASPAELCARVDYELSIIAGTGFIDYFLIVWDFINWARDHGIPVGPGRGSGAGSLVAYCLRITDIDPIRFNLLFERFLNPERVSAPDFDVDFCMRRRDEVVDYVRKKYGADRVSNIITFGTFGAKMVVRDLARILDLPFTEATRLAKLVPDDLNISLENARKKSAELDAEIARNKVAQTIYDEGRVIEGMVRNTGKHACGMIIANRPLTEIVPVTLQEGALTTQYPKKPVEKLGLLKMDFLGLKTLTVIDDAVRFVRRKKGFEHFDIEAPADYRDQPTFDLLNSGKTVAVFQLESEGMQDLCRKFAIATIDEIIALIALYRPGPMQFIDTYIAGKKHPENVEYAHPLLKDISAETYGVLVYQEQVMSAARVVAGYTLGGADELRRAMGKKDPAEMARHRGIFVAGAAKTNSLDEKTANAIFDVLEKFAQYGFNKSHSAAYGILSYRTAYLKANHPVEFMAAMLVSETGNASKVAFFMDECANLGITVLGPDVNASGAHFEPFPAEHAIRYGLGAIKGVGEQAAAAIIAERDRHGPYKDFVDFLERHPGNTLNSRVIEHLVKTGAFDTTGEDRAHLLASTESIKKTLASTQSDRLSGQGSLFDLMDDGGAAFFPAKPRIDHSAPPMPAAEKLQFEKELLGFYLSGHPLNALAGLECVFNTLDRPLEQYAAAEQLDTSRRYPARLVGVVSGVQKKISKPKPNARNKGEPPQPKPWALFNLDTKRDLLTVFLFSEGYEKYGGPELLSEGKIVLIDAEMSFNPERGEWNLQAWRISPFDESRVPALVRGIQFVLEDVGEARDFAERLLNYAFNRANYGGTRLSLGFRQSGGRVLEADIPTSLSVSCSMPFYREFLRHPACCGARVEIVPPSERERPQWGNRRR